MNIEQQLREQHPYGHKDFIRITLENIALHSRKNHDYAYGGDPLGNFKRRSNIYRQWGLDIPPAMVAIMDLMKQLDAAMWLMTQKHEAEVEGVPQRLRDVGIYSTIGEILYEEET